MIKDVTVFLPEGYESGTRRYPLLLSLDSDLPAEEIAGGLFLEGVLPPMIVANRAKESTADGSGLLKSVIAGHRVLESPVARWLCGTGHSAAEALRMVLHRPDLAGRAACLSTSFEGIEGAPPQHSTLLAELEGLKALPSGLRLFLDYGTVGLDECYEPYHRDAGAFLRMMGAKEGREFDIRRVPGGAHDAISWAERLGPGLRWLATH